MTVDLGGQNTVQSPREHEILSFQKFYVDVE
jgi:hypothetical protein